MYEADLEITDFRNGCYVFAACVTVRRSHRHHHRKHCFVVTQRIADTTLYNFLPAESWVVSKPAVYENKG